MASYEPRKSKNARQHIVQDQTYTLCSWARSNWRSAAIAELEPTQLFMTLPKNLNKLAHFPIAPWEEAEKKLRQNQRLIERYIMIEIKVNTYPFLIPFMCKQTVISCNVDLSYIQVEIRCQLTGQGFFVYELNAIHTRKQVNIRNHGMSQCESIAFCSFLPCELWLMIQPSRSTF